MKKNSFYITTTIPYVNADPHIGFALELVQSDAIARYQRLLGKDVFFSTGTDEYGQKIWEASIQEGKNVQDYVDYYAGKFLELKNTLNLSYDNFIRTTSAGHTRASQEFWFLCQKKGDIYKKIYRGLYCVGCERFIMEKDLMDGFCSLHPNKKPEIVEEENYFFRLTNYKKQLLKYLANEKVVFPEWRRREAIDFVENGMEDFSISRDKKRFSWGIPILGDDTQVMYVWFGAFINYISTLGWPNISPSPLQGEGWGEVDLFEKFWVNGETVQTAGKDMVKFQSVMWQGMLMSAGMPTTDTIIYHGFITGEGGVKMSKSIGNVINPNEIVEEYGTDALRYFLLREISSFEDSPFTMERFKEAYNSGLANGLGNLVARTIKMAISYEAFPNVNLETDHLIKHSYCAKYLEEFEIKKAMDEIWGRINDVDKMIQAQEPFKEIKTNPEKAKFNVQHYINEVFRIAWELQPFLPITSKKILESIKTKKMPENLFPRKE